MKNILKKISDVCKIIFGYGVMITLFAGGLTFFGYIAALIIGGDTAAAMCDFIYNVFLKIIIYATSVLILFGLLSMYLAGEKALTPTKRKKGNKKFKEHTE